MFLKPKSAQRVMEHQGSVPWSGQGWKELCAWPPSLRAPRLPPWLGTPRAGVNEKISNQKSSPLTLVLWAQAQVPPAINQTIKGCSAQLQGTPGAEPHTACAFTFCS